MYVPCPQCGEKALRFVRKLGGKHFADVEYHCDACAETMTDIDIQSLQSDDGEEDPTDAVPSSLG